MQLLKKHQAFTAAEVMVTLGLILLVSAVILFAVDPVKIFQNARNSTRASNFLDITNAFVRYIAETPPLGTPRSINDFNGIKSLYERASSKAPSGNCPNGINGINKEINGSFDLDQVDGEKKINIVSLINNKYLTKLPTDPINNGYYKVCIDTANQNKIIIYAPNTENQNSYIYGII